MLDLFRVLCCSYGRGFNVIEVWAGSVHGASEFAKEVMHDANCVINCELIAEGWMPDDLAHFDAVFN